MVFRLVISLLLATCLAGCRKENTLDCFRPNGPFITESRTPGTFHKVTVYSNIDVTVKQGPTYKVEVTSGKNIIGDIRTDLSDSTLTIENLNVCNFVRGYKKKTRVTITTPYLVRLTNMGVGTVNFDAGFSQDVLRVRTESSGDIHIRGTYSVVLTSAHGNGDIYLDGRTRDLQVYTYGTNFLFAQNMDVTGYLYVYTETLGDVIIKVPDQGWLDYFIGSDGNIRYSGQPKVLRRLAVDPEAKGRLIREG